MGCRALLAFAMVVCIAAPLRAQAEDDGRLIPHKTIEEATQPKNITTTIEILFLLTILTLAPSILVMMTSFTRIVIVLSFIRRALATQELPPNQVIIGLALLLTFMIMTPTMEAIKRDALDPYTAEEPQITGEEALDRSLHHLRVFMLRHVRVEDLHMFMELTKQPSREGGWVEDDVPTMVLISSFVISELRRAFIMGFALFLPFLVIDMVVASTLISMGMLVLPPILISLPFKILLFILVDGWHLIVGSLIESFY